ncbi:MAG: glycosyltransferase family 4 protein [Thermoanaerobaculia bacterium]
MSPSRSNTRPRILVVGDAAVPTGFARVIEGIFRPLSERYEIHHLGTNYQGDPHDYPWKVYRASSSGDMWGANRIVSLVEHVRPDLIFALNDIWIQSQYLTALAAMKDHPPVICYCPIDGGPIEAEALAPLGRASRFVAYTAFGKEQVDAAVAAQRETNPDFAFPNVAIIPHGVDTDLFCRVGDPADARREARRRILPHLTDDHFIVLNANRNQPRKRIDITLRGFALFARNKPPTVQIYLHMGSEDLGWNVLQLARRYGIQRRLIMSSLSPHLPTVPSEQMNLVYNACEVGLNTSAAEGWGLVAFEHAAAGGAQVVPRHSACAELWEGSAVLVDPVMDFVFEKTLTTGWLVSPEGVAAALEGLYESPAALEAMSAKAHALAHRPEYRWEAIAGRWDQLFRDVL